MRMESVSNQARRCTKDIQVTISSASVASDRGGNERVVNVSKRAGLISKGFHAKMQMQLDSTKSGLHGHSKQTSCSTVYYKLMHIIFTVFVVRCRTRYC